MYLHNINSSYNYCDAIYHCPTPITDMLSKPRCHLSIPASLTITNFPRNKTTSAPSPMTRGCTCAEDFPHIESGQWSATVSTYLLHYADLKRTRNVNLN